MLHNQKVKLRPALIGAAAEVMAVEDREDETASEEDGVGGTETVSFQITLATGTVAAKDMEHSEKDHEKEKDLIGEMLAQFLETGAMWIVAMVAAMIVVVAAQETSTEATTKDHEGDTQTPTAVTILLLLVIPIGGVHIERRILLLQLLVTGIQQQIIHPAMIVMDMTVGTTEAAALLLVMTVGMKDQLFHHLQVILHIVDLQQQQQIHTMKGVATVEVLRRQATLQLQNMTGILQKGQQTVMVEVVVLVMMLMPQGVQGGLETIPGLVGLATPLVIAGDNKFPDIFVPERKIIL